MGIEVLQRFWAKVDKDGPMCPALGTCCWLWTACDNGYDYGYFRLDGKNVLAHRLSYQWRHGATDSEIDHHCRTPRCVRPGHLRPVTSAQNKQNASDKPKSHNTSGARGVLRRNGRFAAYVNSGRKRYWCGTFDTLEEAGEAARLKRLEVFTHNEVDRAV